MIPLSPVKVALGACLALSFACFPHATAAQTYPLRMGNITTNDVQERLGRTFVETITKRSGGRIEGRLFSSGALGSNDEVMRGLQAGSIQANINPTGFLSQFVPEAGVIAAPWLFPGHDAAGITRNIALVLQGDAGKRIREVSEKRGFRVVSLFGIGPNLIFTRTPIRNMEELRGKRIRSIGGQEHTATINDWGARAIHMSLPEVFTSVQQGVLDGFELPADVAIRLKLHQIAPHVLNTNHVALGQYIAVSKQWYDGLPEDLRRLVDEVGREMEAIGPEQYAKAQMTGLEELRQQKKTTVTDLSPEFLKELQSLNAKGIRAVLEKDGTKREMLQTLLKDVERLAKYK